MDVNIYSANSVFDIPIGDRNYFGQLAFPSFMNGSVVLGGSFGFTEDLDNVVNDNINSISVNQIMGALMFNTPNTLRFPVGDLVLNPTFEIPQPVRISNFMSFRWTLCLNEPAPVLLRFIFKIDIFYSNDNEQVVPIVLR